MLKKEATRDPDADFRTAVFIDLRGAGGPNLVLEPRRGYIAWRRVDVEAGRTIDCAAIKELLHRVADELPRMLAPRNYTSWRNDVQMPEVPDAGADEADPEVSWDR